MVPGKFLGPGGTETDEEDTAVVGIWKVGAHLSRGMDRGGGLQIMGTYIRRRHNTVAEYIAT